MQWALNPTAYGLSVSARQAGRNARPAHRIGYDVVDAWRKALDLIRLLAGRSSQKIVLGADLKGRHVHRLGDFPRIGQAPEMLPVSLAETSGNAVEVPWSPAWAVIAWNVADTIWSTALEASPALRSVGIRGAGHSSRARPANTASKAQALHDA